MIQNTILITVHILMDLMKLLNKRRRRRLVLGFTVMDNKIIDSRDAGLRESGGYKPKS